MNKKTILKALGYTAGATAVVAVMIEPAMAQDLNAVTGVVKNQMPGVAQVLSAASYVGGVGFGIKSALKLKEHNESKGQTPLSQPITLGIVAALLLALPTMLSTAKGSIFGVGSTGTTLDGSTINTIN
jgi:hypothetical protein